MAMQGGAKVTSKLKFLYRKIRFLSKDLRRLLSNALIQPHFDHAYPAWYPTLNKKYKNKLQVNYKTSLCVSAYNWTIDCTSELNILARLPGFQ